MREMREIIQDWLVQTYLWNAQTIGFIARLSTACSHVFYLLGTNLAITLYGLTHTSANYLG